MNELIKFILLAFLIGVITKMLFLLSHNSIYVYIIYFSIGILLLFREIIKNNKKNKNN